LTILLMTAGKACAQLPGYGWGGGYPGVGFGYPGVGYGYTGVGYSYPAFGYGYPAFGYGYPAFGYGLGSGLAYPGPVWSVGYPFPYNPAYGNPLFGVGLSPLGVQSYLFETRLLGRVPRASASYYGAAARRY
jgi:hypothetical protein